MPWFIDSRCPAAGLAPEPGTDALRALLLPKVAWAMLAPPLSLELTARRDGRWIALVPRRGGAYRLDWRAGTQLRAVARLAPSRPLGAASYRMWLESYDKAWAPVDWLDLHQGGGRDFNHLRPGRYRLWVAAYAGEGSVPQLLGPVLLEVVAAPWLRWWAWPGYVLVALALAAYGRRRWRRGELAGRRFLRSLEHELKTPLVAINGLSALLLSAPLALREQRCALAIRQAGEFMGSLLGEGASLEEGVYGDTPLHYQGFDPAALCREVIDCLRPQAMAKGLQLFCRIEHGLPMALYGDPRRIRQVLWNLLANALKFTQHGAISLNCAWCNRAWELSVYDTGPGIPAKQRRRVFRAFVRLDGQIEGRGMGLAICRAWVRRMGGTIRLKALAVTAPPSPCRFCGKPRHGTQAWLRLPLRRAGSPGATMPDRA